MHVCTRLGFPLVHLPVILLQILADGVAASTHSTAPWNDRWSSSSGLTPPGKCEPVQLPMNHAPVTKPQWITTGMAIKWCNDPCGEVWGKTYPV